MSWDQLAAILAGARQVAEAGQAATPVVCPDDGTQLVTNSAGVKGCTFCGWRSDSSTAEGCS